MKKTVLFLLFILFKLIVFSQDTIRLYLDNNFQNIEKEKAILQRTAVINNNHYFITDQYLNGQKVNYCEYSSINPWIENGLAEHYDEVGNYYSSGYYKNGKMKGNWIYYPKYNPDDTVNYDLAYNYLLNNQNNCNAIKSKKLQKSKPVRNDLIDFIQSHLHLPAKDRNLPNDFKINANLLIDKKGLVICPEIIDSKDSDLIIETLRVLFLYKCKLPIEDTISISIPVVFNMKDAPMIDPPYLVVDENASFQGGEINRFRQFIQDQINYNNVVLYDENQNKVVVSFQVSSFGDVSHVRIEASPNPSYNSNNPTFNNEVIRCITNSPKWKPAKIKGKNVKQLFTIPFIYNIKK